MKGTYYPDLADIEKAAEHILGFWVRIVDVEDVKNLRESGWCVTPEPSLGEDIYRVDC